ncbi:MAG: endonuclease III [Candidatus Diapherotrites archaeon]|nr:endonuclease III [Candidatus Diapherotrites archaeon]
MVESLEKKKLHAKKVFSELKKHYSDVPLLFLHYKTDAQMLCAIILSAQSTDVQVNKVTSKLFLHYKTVDDFASADLKSFEQEIKSTGYYKQKAKHVIECFKMIKEKHGGQIPLSMHALIELPGVGRKTANLVLANKGIIEGIATDTHVWRLAQRLGFSKFDSQDKIEKDLMEVFDKKVWHRINGLLISHGRAVCTARNPNCMRCFLNKKKLCPKIGVERNYS